MQTVLVTGASGFLGQYLVKELAAQQVKIKALVKQDSVSKVAFSSSVEVVAGDVLNLADLKNALVDCDTVYHLASVTGRKNVEAHPRHCLDVTILGTRNLLEAALESNLKQFSFVSSLEVDRQPLSTYALAKLAAENYITSYLDKGSINYTIFRLANVFGIGQSHDYVIPIFIQKLLKGERLELHDPQTQRWFVPVEQAVTNLIKTQTPGIVAVQPAEGRITIGQLAQLLTQLVQGQEVDHPLALALAQVINSYRSAN